MAILKSAAFQEGRKLTLTLTLNLLTLTLTVVGEESNGDCEGDGDELG